ncbi:MAG: PspC domain-containing protein [archaeon]
MAAKNRKQIKRLYRSGEDKLVAGVCGGLGEYLEMDPTLIRIAWAVAILVGGIGLLLYLVCWLVVPKNPKHAWN